MKSFIYFSLFVNIILFIFAIFIGYQPALVQFSGPMASSFTIDTTLRNIINSILAIIIAMSVIGLQILGSGLSDVAHAVAIRGIVYAGTWTALSTYSLELLGYIPIFGLIIWDVLTFIYAIGIFMEVRGIMGGDVD